MNQLRTISAIAIAAVFVGMLLQGQGGFRSLFSQALGHHTHCWKQKLYVYTQPESSILCHRGGAEENK